MNVLLLLLVFLLPRPAGAGEPSLDTEDGKILYALGQSVARSLSVFELRAKDLEAFEAGLRDALLGKEAKVSLEEYGPKISALAQSRRTASAEVEKAAAKDFLAKQASAQGAVKAESGLILTEIKGGTGESPSAESKVKVHYHGTLRDGTVFDSSVDRKEPVTFALNQVIPCWTEALQKMKVGGKSRLVCPAEIAYQDRGAPPLIKPGAPLVFEVELLEIVK